jgi:hypothetical protein
MAGWETPELDVVYSGTMPTINGSFELPQTTAITSIGLTQLVTGTNIAANAQVSAIRSDGIQTLNTLVGGSGYVNATYTNVPLTGGSGAGARATIVVSGGAVTSVTVTTFGAGYQVGNTLSASNTNLGGSGAGFSIQVSALYPQVIVMSLAAIATGSDVVTFTTNPNLIKMWQHESGTDAVDGQDVLAINSYFETNDLGWVSGGPSEIAMVGENRWLRLERIEPDFVQSGDMTVVVTGRPFAQGGDVESTEYGFGPDTGKVDMREQRRELRVRFRSNVAGGDYQLGKVILSATIGDVRPY